MREAAARVPAMAAEEEAPVASGTASRIARAGSWLYAGHLWTVFGIALSNGLLALSTLVAVPALAAPGPAVVDRGALRRSVPLLAVFVLYLVQLGISIAFSVEPAASIDASSDLFNLLALPLALVLVGGERLGRRIVDGIVLVAAAASVHGLGQFFVGYGGLGQRIRGPFSHYMTFAGILLVADALLLADLAIGPRRRGWRRALQWLALVAINAALFGSYTRSAWVGLAAAVTLLVLLTAPRWLAAYPVALALFLLLAPQPVVDRALSIFDLEDVSNYDRLCMAQAGLAMIAERPLVGLGPEMVEELYPAYRLPDAPRRRVPHLHNSFLQLAAERGLPALAAYLVMMALALLAAFRGWRARRRAGRDPAGALLLGTLLALVAFNVAGLFEDNWSDTEVQRLVLFLMALPFCLAPPRPQPDVDRPGR